MFTLVNRHSPIWVVGFFAVLFMLPSLVQGAGGGDLLYHLVWSQHFSAQFWAGDIYPRWLHDMNAGCGYPVFFMYPPLPYFLASFFVPLADIAPAGWYPLVASIFIMMWGAGIGCFLWLFAMTQNRFAALCGTAAYLLMPYALFNYHVAHMYSECFTFLWAPWLFYFTHRLAYGSQGAVVGIAFGYAGLFLSSIPGSIVLGGLPLLYFYVVAKRERWLPLSVFLLLGFGLGVGLSAFYWMLILPEMEHLLVGAGAEMWGERLHYANNFLFSPTEHTNIAMVFFNAFVGIIAFVSLFICVRLGITVYRDSTDIQVRKHVWFWLAVAALTFFMMTALSHWLWELLPLLPRIQFPRRLMILLMLALTVVITLFYALPRSQAVQRSDFYWLMGCLVTLSVCITSLFIVSDRQNFLTEQPSDAQSRGFKVLYEHDFVVSQEYLPRWVNRDTFKLDVINRFDLEAIPLFSELCSTQARIVGDGSVVVHTWSADAIILEVIAQEDTTVLVSQFYHPLWHAVHATTGAPYTLSPDPNSGIIKVDLPAGSHVLSLSLAESPYQVYGAWISRASLLMLILLFFVYRRR